MKCPVCKGAKVYVGLNTREACARCKGKGEIGPEVVNEGVALDVTAYGADHFDTTITGTIGTMIAPLAGHISGKLITGASAYSPPMRACDSIQWNPDGTLIVNKGNAFVRVGGVGGVSTVEEAIDELDKMLAGGNP